MNIYYYLITDGYRVYVVPNHYSHSVQYILNTIEFAKTICTVPVLEETNVEVLGKPKYDKMMSVKFTSKTKPIQGIELTKDSGLWEWLKKV